MKRTPVSAKILEGIHREAVTVAKRRGISFSRLVELALVHEMNTKGIDNGVKAELQEVIRFIEEKIDDLDCIDTESVNIEVDDLDSVLEELSMVQKKYGYVNVAMMDVRAEKLGMSVEHLIKEVHNAGLELNYNDL